MKFASIPLLIMLLCSLTPLVGQSQVVADPASLVQQILDRALQNPQAPGWLLPVIRAAAEEAQHLQIQAGRLDICEVESLDDRKSFQAYVKINRESTVYVCPLYHEEPMGGQAQILLHEIFHLIGIDDECDATKMELEVLHYAQQPNISISAYMSKCAKLSL